MKNKKGLEFSGTLMYLIIIIIVAILALVLIYGQFTSFREKTEKVSPEHIVNLDENSFTNFKEVDFAFEKRSGRRGIS
jgi:ABC-type glycerol-3-phosphate transport system permease component